VKEHKERVYKKSPEVTKAITKKAEEAKRKAQFLHMTMRGVKDIIDTCDKVLERTKPDNWPMIAKALNMKLMALDRAVQLALGEQRIIYQTQKDKDERKLVLLRDELRLKAEAERSKAAGGITGPEESDLKTVWAKRMNSVDQTVSN